MGRGGGVGGAVGWRWPVASAWSRPSPLRGRYQQRTDLCNTRLGLQPASRRAPRASIGGVGIAAAESTDGWFVSGITTRDRSVIKGREAQTSTVQTFGPLNRRSLVLGRQTPSGDNFSRDFGPPNAERRSSRFLCTLTESNRSAPANRCNRTYLARRRPARAASADASVQALLIGWRFPSDARLSLRRRSCGW